MPAHIRISAFVLARREPDGRWAYWLELARRYRPAGFPAPELLFRAEPPGRLKPEQQAVIANRSAQAANRLRQHREAARVNRWPGAHLSTPTRH